MSTALTPPAPIRLRSPAISTTIIRVLALTALLMSSSALHAADPSSSSSNYGAAMAANGSNQHFWFANADNVLCVKYGNGSTWNVWASGQKIAGDPSAVMDASGGNHHVWFRNPDDKLAVGWYANSQWNFGVMGDRIIGSPSVAMDANGNQRVWFRNDRNQLCVRWISGSSWVLANMMDDIAGNPHAVMDGNGGSQQVWFRNTQNQLCVKYWDGSTWRLWNSRQDIAGDPSISMDGNGGSRHVWFRNQSNKLRVGWIGGGQWVFGGHDDIAGNPCAVMSANGENHHVWFRNSANELCVKYFSGGSWRFANMGRNIFGDPCAVMAPNGTNHNIWFSNPNGKQCHMWIGNGAWQFDNMGNRMSSLGEKIGVIYTLYSSEKNAVIAATAASWDRSLNSKLEYGGVIYKIKGQDLYGYILTMGEKHEINVGAYYPASASDVVGFWHTHPNRASTGPSPADIFAMIPKKGSNFLETHTLWTIVYFQGDNRRPVPVGLGGRNDYKMTRLGQRTPAEWEAQVRSDVHPLLLQSDTRKSYLLTLKDTEISPFMREVVGPVSFTVNMGRQPSVSFGVGPVSISTAGNICGTLGGTFVLTGQIGCCSNIPALLTGDWAGVMSAFTRLGAGLGAEVNGIGLTSEVGATFTFTFKDEGPGNNWGQLVNGL